MAAKNEELGDIEDGRIVARWRAACGQHKSHDPTAMSDEKWEPTLRLGPVERKLGVTEASIRPQLDGRERLAEVVKVQLEEVRQQRGITPSRHLENDLMPIYHVKTRPARLFASIVA